VGYLKLGCMNGWVSKPKEYLKCVDLKHKQIRINLWQCYNKYVCNECKIQYEVDSSG